MREKEEVFVTNAVGVPQLSEPRAEGLQLVFRYRHLADDTGDGQQSGGGEVAARTRKPLIYDAFLRIVFTFLKLCTAGESYFHAENRSFLMFSCVLFRNMFSSNSVRLAKATTCIFMLTALGLVISAHESKTIMFSVSSLQWISK